VNVKVHVLCMLCEELMLVCAIQTTTCRTYVVASKFFFHFVHFFLVLAPLIRKGLARVPTSTK